MHALTCSCTQDVLHGPHTTARNDLSLTSLVVSPPAEGRKAGKAAARQTGLSSFYKSKFWTPRRCNKLELIKLWVCVKV